MVTLNQQAVGSTPTRPTKRFNDLHAYHKVYRYRARGARFEDGSAAETIGPDLLQSFSSQSLTEEAEADGERVKPHRTG
jgi:hypothetical protein